MAQSSPHDVACLVLGKSCRVSYARKTLSCSALGVCTHNDSEALSSTRQQSLTNLTTGLTFQYLLFKPVVKLCLVREHLARSIPQLRDSSTSCTHCGLGLAC